MTIPVAIPKRIYDGNDVTTNFSFPVFFRANADLVVIHRNIAGDENTLVLDTDYTVNGAGTDTGSVDFPKSGSSYSTLATGEKIGIFRAQDKERDVDISGSYHFDTLNNDGDNLVMMVQELKEEVDRCAKYDRTNTATPPRLEDVQVTLTSDIERTIEFRIFQSDTSVITGNGKEIALITAAHNGWKVVDVSAGNHTKGITGTTDIQLRKRQISNDTDVDVLSTKVTIGDERYAEDGVIDTTKNTVLTGDQLYVDVDAVHSGTAPLGLTVAVRIQAP